MGISQHVHGTDNARCLIALAMVTGQIGRPGTGLHPLRGQNNVQGASDSGLIPMVYPDYQRVDNPEARHRFEKLWGVSLDPRPGLTVVEILNAASAGRIRGLYVMGENPAMSDPDVDLIPAAERPDAQYPTVLITGRQLEHWHTGSMTRRTNVLDTLEPEPVASMHPLELERIGVRAGEIVTVQSRRGSVSLYARADDGIPVGAVFMAFCYYEAAANKLTNPALDPFGKIPEFKYCAVRVLPGGATPQRIGYGASRETEAS